LQELISQLLSMNYHPVVLKKDVVNVL